MSKKLERSPYCWLEPAPYANAALEARDEEDFLAAMKQLCVLNRIHALSLCAHAGRGWLGASLSCTELLTALYFSREARVDPDDVERDRIVLSKGHAAAMQYAVLCARGTLPLASLQTYKQPHGLQAHTDRSTAGIEINSGSLGQALSKSAGLALAGARYVFTLLGDGELQEGQNYEALMSIAHYGLHQVVPIVDVNGIQSDSSVSDIMALPDLEGLFRSFGFDVLSFNGQDVASVMQSLAMARLATQPTVLLAHTSKGAGISFMEAKVTSRRAYKWHGGVPQGDDYRAALIELAARPDAGQVGEAVSSYLKTVAPGEKVPTRSPSDMLSTGEALTQALERSADAHAELVCLDADLEKPCCLSSFAQRFPQQFFEMGIAEQNMVSVAGGLALAGRKPVVHTYAAFYRRALEQVYVNATEKSHILYCGHYAGLCYATDGKTHQCTGDVAMFRGIPGLQVFHPAFPEEVSGLLDWHLSGGSEGPVYVRLHRTPGGQVPSSSEPLQFHPGRGLHLRQSGAPCALLTGGPHLATFGATALDALSTKWDHWSISPLTRLDDDFLRQLASTYSLLAVAEENLGSGLFHVLQEGFARLCEHDAGFSCPKMVHKAPNDFTFSTLDPFGLYAYFKLDAEGLSAWLSGMTA